MNRVAPPEPQVRRCPTPDSDETGQIRVSIDYLTFSLLYRRGKLYHLTEEYGLEAENLRRATQQLQTLVTDFPRNSDYLLQRMETQLAFTELQFQKSRLVPAMQASQELRQMMEKLQSEFPEVAKASMIFAKCKISEAAILRRQNRLTEASQVSGEVVTFLDGLTKVDSTAAPLHLFSASLT